MNVVARIVAALLLVMPGAFLDAADGPQPYELLAAEPEFVSEEDLQTVVRDTRIVKRYKAVRLNRNAIQLPDRRELPDRPSRFSTSQTVMFTPFDVTYYITNTSVHRISQSIGWWGKVLDVTGTVLGFAQLLYRDGVWSGDIELDGGTENYKLESLGGRRYLVYQADHEAFQKHHRLNDMPPARSEEERQAARARWSEYINQPHIVAARTQRDLQPGISDEASDAVSE